MTKEIITSVSDIIKLASTKSHYGSNQWWFRGQPDKEYKLQPGLFRPENGKFYNENKLISEFIRIHPKAQEKHSDIIELLTYAQHYGLPTRLLDWTENALVALFFACRDKPNKDGKVFFLPSYIEEVDFFDFYNFGFGNHFIRKLIELNAIEDFEGLLESEIDDLDRRYKDIVVKQLYVSDMSFFDYKKQKMANHFHILHEPVDIKYLTSGSNYSTHAGFMYKPKKINKRLVAQQGCFTCHTGKIIDGIPVVNTNDIFERIAYSFDVPQENKENIMNELKYCGIYEATLFPELDYQTKYIKSISLDN
ncbi:TPA: FRG domain-containing protein [Providencia rettgeri]|uniref:FRG domain-containing protein n=1 Tax=Providencia rettgeri TaxID=587 RepID=UPI0032EB2ED3